MAVQHLNRCASLMHQQRQQIKCTTTPQMKKMNVYTGTYWKSILRVVVAIVVTDATRVKSIKYYDPYFKHGNRCSNR